MPHDGPSGRAGPGPAAPYDAVVLAGGGARRLGGADKPGVDVGGLTLIERVVAAVPDAARLVVVAPRRAGLPRARFVQERPPGGGPVPALRAGLAATSAPWVALLAADLPFLLPAHIAALLAAAAGSPGPAGAVLVDERGREQWLTGVWRADALTPALAAYEGRSLYGLLGPLDPVRLSLAVEDDGRVPWFDCDTVDDVTVAREKLSVVTDEYEN
ncbi:NTP transferase domain-containing protein [Sphaerisporangium sp. TRM90804]|uniref:molybdenum cofactor guanylyltransferase n=1 Tax=Sphaerisporangium sp. TRM90804 TaxID=3031113 RepID=UPI00244B2E15|nr:NTP transferase domain-containing protein [Sphaerisporangium sp. TRM90804]MDH2430182.1 NTP transferase domain-containing protein [Sphaerisporangium sp. TRM90804]